MKAIRTKTIGATDHKMQRIKADDGDGNHITLNWSFDHASDGEHRRAAEALCEKMGWSKNLKFGVYKDAYYWVFVK